MYMGAMFLLAAKKLEYIPSMHEVGTKAWEEQEAKELSDCVLRGALYSTIRIVCVVPSISTSGRASGSALLGFVLFCPHHSER